MIQCCDNKLLSFVCLKDETKFCFFPENEYYLRYFDLNSIKFILRKPWQWEHRSSYRLEMAMTRSFHGSSAYLCAINCDGKFHPKAIYEKNH